MKKLLALLVLIAIFVGFTGTFDPVTQAQGQEDQDKITFALPQGWANLYGLEIQDYLSGVFPGYEVELQPYGNFQSYVDLLEGGVPDLTLARASLGFQLVFEGQLPLGPSTLEFREAIGDQYSHLPRFILDPTYLPPLTHQNGESLDEPVSAMPIVWGQEVLFIRYYQPELYNGLDPELIFNYWDWENQFGPVPYLDIENGQIGDEFLVETANIPDNILDLILEMGYTPHALRNWGLGLYANPDSQIVLESEVELVGAFGAYLADLTLLYPGPTSVLSPDGKPAGWTIEIRVDIDNLAFPVDLSR